MTLDIKDSYGIILYINQEDSEKALTCLIGTSYNMIVTPWASHCPHRG